MNSQISNDIPKCDSSKFKIKIHHKNLSEMNGSLSFDANCKFDKDLKINPKLLDFKSHSKISHLKQLKEIKSEFNPNLNTSTTGFNTNYITNFFGKKSNETSGNNFTVKISPVKENENKNFTLKLKNPNKSENFSNSHKESIAYSKIIDNHTKSQDFTFPNIVFRFKNHNLKAIPNLWKSEKKIKNSVEQKQRNNFDKSYLEENKSNKRNSVSLTDYLNLKNSNLYLLNTNNKEIKKDQTNTNAIYSNKSKIFENSKNSQKKIKLKIFTENQKILKNLKNTCYINFKNPLTEQKEKKDAFNSLKTPKIIKSQNSSKNKKIKTEDDIQNFNLLDFDSSSDYLNHLQRNIQLEFQRKFPEYKTIKQFDSQLKIKEAISTPYFSTANKLSLIIKKPYFHLNRNICFPYFLNDRHMLLKIHKNNMKSLESKINKVKGVEKNLKIISE